MDTPVSSPSMHFFGQRDENPMNSRRKPKQKQEEDPNSILK